MHFKVFCVIVPSKFVATLCDYVWAKYCIVLVDILPKIEPVESCTVRHIWIVSLYSGEASWPVE